MRNYKQGILLKRVAIIMLIVTLIAPVVTNSVAYEYNTNYTKYRKLGIGEYEKYEIYYSLSKGDEISIEVSVLSGEYIDVYLLMSYQYEEYFADANATNTTVDFDYISEGSQQSTKYFKYTYEVKYDDAYYIVIDNRNNSQPNDAVPTGEVEVSVNYTIKHKYPDYYPPFEEYFSKVGLICISIAIIVIVIVVAIIVISVRSTKKKQPPTPPIVLQPPY